VADPEAARALLDEALALAHAHGERWWVPELLRRRALLDPNARTLGERLPS
jgi:hypothetical protein